MATIRLTDISVLRGHAAVGGVFRRAAQAISGVSRAFALEHLTLTVPDGKTVVLLGPSGCGKSTLLRIIAGLDAPDAGRVLFDGRDVAGISPGERRIGYLFQSYALYPHFSSRGNITSYFFFRPKTPEMNRLREEKFRRTSELLDVDISYLLDRRPSRLSGGEKQRVAQGRCITREPALFLLDEPFSNLDAKLRARYRLHLKTLLREFGITTVYVTHDQQEAVLLGDLIAVMRTEHRGDRNVGLLEQLGTVQELYEHPASRFVADFLNLQGDVPAIGFLNGAALDPALAGFTVGVRPEAVQIVPAGGTGGDAGEAPALPARVAEVAEDPLRQHRVLTLAVGPDLLVAKVPPETPAAPGDAIAVRFRAYHVFDSATGETVHRPEAAHALLG